MKVIVADKISEHGVKLLKETCWNIVQTTKETLAGELPDADALIVRSATKVTPDLMSKAPRLRVVGRAGVGVGVRLPGGIAHCCVSMRLTPRSRRWEKDVRDIVAASFWASSA